MSEKNILMVKKLCKDEILKNVDFEIKEGEMVAIMGPSGSGKSTLLYQVSGMDTATSGEVWLDGTDLCKLSEDKLAGVRLEVCGFVFQQMNMLENLTILQNIVLPADHLEKEKRKRIEHRENAKQLMKKLSIENLGERSITQVSGGQLQRACICRSLINKPKILFADEPTGALNQTASKEVMESFVKVNEGGTTILLVTHDGRIASQCDRILYLLDGTIKGELNLSQIAKRNDKEKERFTNQWLADMGW